jgi:hypothetical protein
MCVFLCVCRLSASITTRSQTPNHGTTEYLSEHCIEAQGKELDLYKDLNVPARAVVIYHACVGKEKWYGTATAYEHTQIEKHAFSITDKCLEDKFITAV